MERMLQLRGLLICRDGKIVIDITVPANTTAVLELPERQERIEVGSGTWHYEYATDTSLKEGMYSANTTLAELADSDETACILEKYLPGMADGPMAAFLLGKTLNEVIALAPQQRGQIEAMLKELNL